MSRTPKMRSAVLAALASLVLWPAPASAQSSGAVTFVTLGTQGGPLPSATRSQPANLLIEGGEATLVDSGDGAAERLAAAGVQLFALKRVFISHLHFDHTGGLGAVLGLRYATNSPGRLVIYGPPGTKELVDGIVASMRPTSEAGYGVPGEVSVPPEDTVSVVELTGGTRLQVGDMSVRAVANTHYSFAPASPQAKRFQSLSYRFEGPGWSIVYTGDTGPSAAVEGLAEGADLLVSEMIDLPSTIATIRAQRPDMPAPALEQMVRHLTDHHLTPERVGELAARAHVRRLVVTHLAGRSDAEALEQNRAAIAARYAGPTTIARDLDRFDLASPPR